MPKYPKVSRVGSTAKPYERGAVVIPPSHSDEPEEPVYNDSTMQAVKPAHGVPPASHIVAVLRHYGHEPLSLHEPALHQQVANILGSNGPQTADGNAAKMLCELTGRGMHELFSTYKDATDPPQHLRHIFDAIGSSPDHESAVNVLNHGIELYGGGIFSAIGRAAKGIWNKITGSTAKAVETTKHVVNRVASGVKAIATGEKRLNFAPASRELLQQMGNAPVFSLEVAKTPVVAVAAAVVNAVSMGEANRLAKDKGWGTLWHLFMILRVGDSEYEFGKEATVIFKKFDNSKRNQKGFVSMELPLSSEPVLTTNLLIEGGLRSMGIDKFYLYDGKDNNCQNFVLHVLAAAHADGYVKYDWPTVDKFVYQDVSSVWKAAHKSVPSIFNKVTDFAHTLDVAIHGQGFDPAHLAELHHYCMNDSINNLHRLSGGALHLVQHIFQNVPPISPSATTDWTRIAHAPNAAGVIKNIKAVNQKGGFTSQTGFQYPVSHIVTGLRSEKANDKFHFVDYKGLSADPECHGIMEHLPLARTMHVPTKPQSRMGASCHRTLNSLAKKLRAPLSFEHPSLTDHSELRFVHDHVQLNRLGGSWLAIPPDSTVDPKAFADARNVSNEDRAHMKVLSGRLLASQVGNSPAISVMTYDKAGNFYHIGNHGVEDAHGNHFPTGTLPASTVGGALERLYQPLTHASEIHMMHDVDHGLDFATGQVFTPLKSVLSTIAPVRSPRINDRTRASAFCRNVGLTVGPHDNDHLAGMVARLKSPLPAATRKRSFLEPPGKHTKAARITGGGLIDTVMGAFSGERDYTDTWNAQITNTVTPGVTKCYPPGTDTFLISDAFKVYNYLKLHPGACDKNSSVPHPLHGGSMSGGGLIDTVMGAFSGERDYDPSNTLNATLVNMAFPGVTKCYPPGTDTFPISDAQKVFAYLQLHPGACDKNSSVPHPLHGGSMSGGGFWADVKDKISRFFLRNTIGRTALGEYVNPMLSRSKEDNARDIAAMQRRGAEGWGRGGSFHVEPFHKEAHAGVAHGDLTGGSWITSIANGIDGWINHSLHGGSLSGGGFWGNLWSGVKSGFSSAVGAVSSVVSPILNNVVKPLASMIPAPLLSAGLDLIAPEIGLPLQALSSATGSNILGSILGQNPSPPPSPPPAAPAPTDPNTQPAYSVDQVQQYVKQVEAKYQAEVNQIRAEAQEEKAAAPTTAPITRVTNRRGRRPMVVSNTTQVNVYAIEREERRGLLSVPHHAQYSNTLLQNSLALHCLVLVLVAPSGASLVMAALLAVTLLESTLAVSLG